MILEYQEYTPRKVLNVHKHVDGPWFWVKYSAHPYVGCRSGCEFCYSRGSYYLGRRDPEGFDTLIQVKTNAVELLRKELEGLPHEIISTGDWQQPAESRYRLSRGMLEVVLEHGLPLFIVERSPLLVRDLDLLVEINRHSWVGVLFSISNLDPELKQAFEPRSPGVKRRLMAMAQLAEAGITVGTSMMPVIPFVGDDEEHLDALVQATKGHGGICVLAGGLTMDGVQAERTLAAARRFDPELESPLRMLYHWPVGGKPSYGPNKEYASRFGYRVRRLCERHGLLDRLPRYIPPGPLAVNKRIAERLFLKTYDLELAWTIDERSESVADIYQQRGQAGLRELPNIGRSLAAQIAQWVEGMDKS
jgi:DNA repair photolyase